MDLYLGIDFGTSGARGVVIDEEASCIQSEVRYAFQDSPAPVMPKIWQEALFVLLEQIPEELRREIKAIAINGTSSTVLLVDAAGNPTDAPLLYNDARGSLVLEHLRSIAPPNHTVLSSTSSRAKLLWMMQLPTFR